MRSHRRWLALVAALLTPWIGPHIFAAIAGAAWIGLVASREPTSSLIGRWQYIQPPDNEGEVLDMSLSGGRYRGIMNGLERAGEHGLFYYAVELAELTGERFCQTSSNTPWKHANSESASRSHPSNSRS